jgi:GT2 family glycosyltransferase
MALNDNLISVSVVLYKSNVDDIHRLMNCLQLIKIPVKIYIIDNSPLDLLRYNFHNIDVEYIFNPSNPGFGSSHNIALKKSIEMGYRYHLVVNPDIYFQCNVVESLIEVLKNNRNVGMIMPQILNLDNTIQYLPKLLPNPFSILLRKIKFPNFLFKLIVNKYELRNVSKDCVCNVPVLSGCFTLLSLNCVKEVGFYDDNFFMYFEDWDLSRRMHEKYITLYFPKVSVNHGYESGANKSLKLFFVFLKSAIYYFNKWGWFFDKNRNLLNSRAIAQFNK